MFQVRTFRIWAVFTYLLSRLDTSSQAQSSSAPGISMAVAQHASGPDYSTPALDMAHAVGIPDEAPIADYPHDEHDSFMKSLKALKKPRNKGNLQMEETTRSQFAHPKGSAKDFEVRTNYFSMDFINAPNNRLYLYNISGIDTNAPRSEKRAFVKRLIERCDLLREQKDCFATDNLGLIVAWKDLSLHDSFVADMSDDTILAQTDVPKPGMGNLPAKTATQKTLTVALLRKFEYENINEIVLGRGDQYLDDFEQLDQALHIIIRKAIQEQSGESVFQIGTSKVFPKAGHEPLDTDNKVAIRGYTYSHHEGMGSHFLNVNTSTSVFHLPMTVSKYISSDWSLTRDLIGVKVWVNFKRSPNAVDRKLDERNRRIKTIADFTRHTASQQVAYTDKNKKSVTVYEHMQKSYRGRFSGTPQSTCVNVGGTDPGTEVWFMAEDLNFLPYQQFRGDLSSDLTTALINKACRIPEQNVLALASEFLPLLGIEGATDLEHMPGVLQEAKIRIYPELACVPAYLTTIPKAVYRGEDKTSAEGGTWMLTKQVFLSSCQFQGPVHFLIPGQGMRGRAQQSAYLKLFFDHYQTNGLGGLPERFTGLDNTNHSILNSFRETDMRAALQTARGVNAGLVVLILPENNKTNLHHYGLFKKLCDQEFGFVSVCLCEKKIMNFFPGRDGIPASVNERHRFPGYVRNVAMKLNVRLGNSNHTGTQLKDNVPNYQTDNVVILGADVFHPGHGSQQYTPSCAAVVGSVDAGFTKYFGSARYQPGRQEIITGMKVMVQERLQAYKKHNSGRLPTRIVYYRDGVDKGQFSKVRNQEVTAIREAWESVAHGTNAHNTGLKVTAIVVTKRHNTRIYPAEAGPSIVKNGNCLPGTVVESGITLPYHFDFYLLSQKAIKGTGRPAHYIVLTNEMGFSPAQLHSFTNILCYTYCRSTTAVSYVPAA